MDSIEQAIAKNALNSLAVEINDNAKQHGFYEDDFEIAALLRPGKDSLRAIHEVNMAMKRLALITSEVGETVEAVRKPGAAYHIYKADPDQPEEAQDFTQEEEEIADVLIRVLDYAAFRSLRIGEATIAKMAFNRSRPRLHGKNC